ncbi:MAG: crossover junction endodeoxyribonuclease RuvC [Candidatus Vogelbacteria bacterium]|nr:crossover junction endodeoxyribonuclease RuvC [Candidatus Vogelbacteria bacterium]
MSKTSGTMRRPTRLMKILGIDPGYDRLGLALIERSAQQNYKIIYSACLTSPRGEIFAERLYHLVTQVATIIKQRRPDLLALEEVFFASNRKTAMAVAEVRGALLYLARQLKVSVINLTPLEVKMAMTGYGQASKEQVKYMVERLLGFKKKRSWDDEVDALAIALTGALKAASSYPQLPRATIAKKSRYAKK